MAPVWCQVLSQSRDDKNLCCIEALDFLYTFYWTFNLCGISKWQILKHVVIVRSVKWLHLSILLILVTPLSVCVSVCYLSPLRPLGRFLSYLGKSCNLYREVPWLMSHYLWSKVKVTRGHWNHLLLCFNVIEWTAITKIVNNRHIKPQMYVYGVLKFQFPVLKFYPRSKVRLSSHSYFHHLNASTAFNILHRKSRIGSKCAY